MSPVVYRMTVRSNPRILVVVTVIPVILLVGIGMLFLLGVSYGLFALALALLAAWSVLRFIRRQLAERIETTEDKIMFTRRGGQEILYPWTRVRLAGIALAAEPRARTDFRDISLSRGETLNGKLRELAGQQ